MEGRSCPCAFDNNGRFLALLTPDGRLKVWDCTNGLLKHQYTPSSHLATSCTCLKWSSCSRGSDPPRRKKQKTSQHSSACSTSVSIIALGTLSGDILIYNLAEGDIQQRLTESHTDRVNDLAWNVNETLYSCSSDKYIVEWCVNKAEPKSKWKADRHGVHSICISPLGDHLLSAGRSIKLWDLETKGLLKKFTGHASPISELVFLSSPSMSDSNANHVPEKSINGLYFLSGSKDERLLNVWFINLESKDKNALVSLSLTDNPASVDVIQCEAKERSVQVAVISSDGYLHIFEKTLNGGGKKPLTPTKTIHLTTPEKNKSSTIPIICSKLVAASEPSILIAYGSIVKPQFESLSYSPFDIETCLIRENTSSLSVKQHSQPTGPVDKADRSLTEVTTLGPSNLAVARPSAALNGEKGGLSLSSNGTDTTEQSLEDRLKAMAKLPKEKKFSGRKIATASSMVQMLTQALHSEDKHLMEDVLGVTKGNLIRNTVRKLPVQCIVPFIRELIYRIQLSPNRGFMLAVWLKYILSTHMSYLMTVPNLVESLSNLYTMMETRVGVYGKLCKLQGRLDLVLSQVEEQNETSSEMQRLDEPLAVYEEEDSEEDEVLVGDTVALEGEHSDSEIKWDEDMEDEGDISSDSEEEEEIDKNNEDGDDDDEDDEDDDNDDDDNEG